MKTQETILTRQALIYLLRVTLQSFMGMILFFISAGTLRVTRGWIFFIVVLILNISGHVYLLFKNPELMNERAVKRDNTKSWDKILLSIYMLLAFFMSYIVAGLDIRFQWSHISFTYFYPALLVIIIASIFGIWAMAENKHFEATSRIQDDRNQTVCSTGPYAIVRHPGYLGVVLTQVSLPFIFGSWYVGIISFSIIIIMTIRTYLEDTMLQDELPGYKEYTKLTRYRLIPFVW